MGKYLQKKTSDYVGCAIIGCQKNCCVELVAMFKDGSRIYVPGCDRHISQVHVAKNALEKGQEPKEVRVYVTVGGEKREVGLSLSELYYRAPGEVNKKRAKEEQEKLDKARVVKSWKWVDDFDMWMNAAGKVVPIKELDDKEIEDAVILIRRVNVKRRTKRIEWVKALEDIAPPVLYEYPESELEVDVEDAYSKLDEFYEECRSRGILP